MLHVTRNVVIANMDIRPHLASHAPNNDSLAGKHCAHIVAYAKHKHTLPNAPSTVLRGLILPASL